MLVKLRDYERIHRIISTVVRSEGVDPAHACTFFAVFGSHIVKTHYKKQAIPFCGQAALFVGGSEKNVLYFGDLPEPSISGNVENFHCWIEVDGWVIDFMAPEFPKLFGREFPIPARMFQKRKADMVSDINNLSKVGDFFLAPNSSKAIESLGQFWEAPIYADLAQICSDWFVKFPKDMPTERMTTNGKGSLTRMKLTGPSVTDRW